MLKFAIVISIVCIQTLLINAGNDEDIQLGWLAMGMLSNWGQCDKRPWFVTRGAMRYTNDVIYSESDAECLPGHWILDWDKEDLGESQNNQDCLPVSASNQIGDCKTCPCTKTEYLRENLKGLNRFSLRVQESDVAHNKVVTGVRFVSGSQVIHLQIKQATLQKNGHVKNDGEWVHVEQVAYYRPGEKKIQADEFLITARKRVVYLDRIIIPSNYSITGVKFTPIQSGKGIRLQIRGTTHDDSGNLDYGSHYWFDSSTSVDASFGQTRQEIDLANSRDSPVVPTSEELKITNHFVRFRGAAVNEEVIFHTIPRLSTAPAESMGDTPPQGIQLSYEGHPGYIGHLTFDMIGMNYAELPDSEFEFIKVR